MALLGKKLVSSVNRQLSRTNIYKLTFSFNQNTVRNCSKQAQFKVLYDGNCPLCLKEVSLLKKINRRPGTMNFVNIQNGQYKPENHNGITYEEAMGLLHVIGPDNKVYIGMEATRELYDSVGWGWIMQWTSLPGMNAMTDTAYKWFANNRYKLTGRENPCEDPNRCRITGLKNDQKIKENS